MCNPVTGGFVTLPPTRPDPTRPLNVTQACILTVGAHEQPTITRPDLVGDACQIEHLDFTPPCDSRLHIGTPAPPAYAIAFVRTICEHTPIQRLLCQQCLEYVGKQHEAGWVCITCGACTDDGRPLLLSWEPLR